MHGRSLAHLVVVDRDGDRLLDGDSDPWVRISECGARIGEVLRRREPPPLGAGDICDYCASCARAYLLARDAYDAGDVASRERARRGAARPLVRVPHRAPSKARREEP